MPAIRKYYHYHHNNYYRHTENNTMTLSVHKVIPNDESSADSLIVKMGLIVGAKGQPRANNRKLATAPAGPAEVTVAHVAPIELTDLSG
jgi:hypothetical protein